MSNLYSFLAISVLAASLLHLNFYIYKLIHEIFFVMHGFLAHLAIGHESNYRHLTSVIVDVNISKKIFSEIAEWIWLQLCMIVPEGILHKVIASIFELLKNMAAITKKIEQTGLTKDFLDTSQKLLT